MRNKLLIAIFLLGLSSVSFLHAQNVGIGTNTPIPSAKLEIRANNMGLMIPQVSLVAVSDGVTPVNAPATGLLVWNTNAAVTGGTGQGFYYWDGGSWQRLAVAGTTSDAWLLQGNAGTNPATNFVGTTDNQPLVVRTNNTENARVNTNGNVGIGTTSNTARLYTYVPGTDATTQYGIRNEFLGSTNSSNYGIHNTNNSTGTGFKYGIHNTVTAVGSGGRYGLINLVYMNGGSNGLGFGEYTYLDAHGSNNHYGSYTDVIVNGNYGGSYNFGDYKRIRPLDPNNSTNLVGDWIEIEPSSGTRYGEYKRMDANSTTGGLLYGDYNEFTGTSNTSVYGHYNLLNTAGTGIRYGVYNNINSSGTGAKYGVRNQFYDEQGTKYGTYNYYPNGTETGTIYGHYNYILNDASSTKYGGYTYISSNSGSLRGYFASVNPSASNTSTAYGVYGTVGSSGTGRHYGGYFSAYGDGNYATYGTNSHPTGWAGYFVGNFYADGNSIINESGNADHDFRVETDNRTHAIYADSDENLVRFGNSATGSDWQNGSTVNGTTVDYVVDMDAGNVTGTAIGIGSVEYLLDMSSETTINNRFSPSTDNVYDLGSPTLRWDDVYATNGTIVTSDAREKTQISDMNYGLKEIMALRPVTYKWKRDRIGTTTLSDSDKELKLGLIAQEVKSVLPEVVQTHDWRPVSESEPENYQKVENDRLGMSYHELIPVMIKAMQEQQEQIDAQNERIQELEALLKANSDTKSDK